MENRNLPPESVYKCPHITQPVKVDGLLDEPVWQQVPPLSFLIPVTLQQPLSKTEARLLWDDSHLYVGFKAYDQDVWSYLTQRDSTTCSEDVLEVFLKPDAAKESYYNFEINALSTVYDAFNLKRGAGGEDHHRWSRWNCEGLRSAVTIKGTINDHTDVDEYWQMEIAVPFAELPSLDGRAPAPGDKWQFHLGRYDYSVYLPEGVELSSCARLSEVDFHRYEDWMTLEFVKYSN